MKVNQMYIFPLNDEYSAVAILERDCNPHTKYNGLCLNYYIQYNGNGNKFFVVGYPWEQEVKNGNCTKRDIEIDQSTACRWRKDFR